MRNILYLMLLACCLVGCPKNEPAHPSVSADTIVDATGISFKLPVSTGRIISLAPSITENIKTLDAQGSLVGRTDFCKITDVASVGTILEPSIEKIISLKPDLILATKEGNNPKTVERLRGLKAEMFVFGESNSWDDIKSNFRLCGRLLDKSAKAEQILKDIQDELSLINVRVGIAPDDGRPEYFYQ
ncbi:MAG: ABC transporter substrate-binding protein [Planctomycetes bacterium]|nr:ABC transporter substrate-binding protein [Planctomycetota bacterium]